MALSFDGSSSYLSRSAGGLFAGYPFTIFLWTRARSTQTGFAVHVAIDPSASGSSEGHGVIQSSSRMQAWSTSSGTGGATAVYSKRLVTTGDWVPCMVVFAGPTSRKVYYGTDAVQASSTNVIQNPAILNVLSIGKQAVRSAYYWAGDLACVGLWRTELSQTDYNSLVAGTVPSAVQTTSLVDYWPLLTQAASQTGINGGVLLANQTSQASSHPIAETAGAPDTTAPTLSGTLTVGSVTSTGYTLAWPAGTDNVAVSSYEYSLNLGTNWTNVGNVLAATIGSRTPSATDTVQLRARDAAGNVSTVLSTTVTLLAAPDTSAPTLTGSLSASAITTTTYTLSWPTATDNVGVAAYDLSLDGGTTWTDVGKALTVNVTGRTPGATDSVRVRARDSAGNQSASLATSVTLATPADNTAPTLGGTVSASTVTSTGYTLNWSAASDNVGVVSYERSLDGGATWTNVGNVLTSVVTGRTPGTIDLVRIRAKDAAGNVSAVLALSVTLPGVAGQPGFATPPLKNNTGTLLANLAGLTINVYHPSSGALVVQKSGLTSNAEGVVSVNDAALVAGSTYAYEVVTPANGRRLPVVAVG